MILSKVMLGVIACTQVSVLRALTLSQASRLGTEPARVNGGDCRRERR
jgi:hypothetical protein